MEEKTNEKQERTSMEETIKRVEIPTDASFEDLYDLRLDRPLKEAADRVTTHNLQLIARAKKSDFDPVKELNASKNQGSVNLHYLAEQVALYREGWVPYKVALECRETCNQLVEQLMELDNTPILELDNYQYAMNEFFNRWMVNYKQPRMSEFYYKKRLFELLDDVNEALKLLHRQYVILAGAHKKRRRTRATKRKWPKFVLTVLNRIEALCEKGYSKAKAIEMLRTSDIGAQMFGVSDSSWKSYYYAYKRGE